MRYSFTQPRGIVEKGAKNAVRIVLDCAIALETSNFSLVATFFQALAFLLVFKILRFSVIYAGVFPYDIH